MVSAPPGELPLIRELLPPEEFDDLLRRLVWVMPVGPLVAYDSVFEQSSNS